MTIEQIRAEREMREARARERAAALPPGDYFASGCFVVERESRRDVVECETHWDACLVIVSPRAGRP